MPKLLQLYPDLAGEPALMPNPAAWRPMQPVSVQNATAARQRGNAADSLSGTLQYPPSPVLPSCSMVQIERTDNRVPATIPRAPSWPPKRTQPDASTPFTT